MSATPFHGVYPAMVTPFRSNGRIDFDQLRAEAHRLVDAGVDGLVPMGSTGESATVSHDEHVAVIEAVVEAVPDTPVIAGTGSNSTQEALELSEAAAAVGADGLLLIGPYYNRPTQQGLTEHYRMIADAVDLPQIVYNVPSRTGRNIAPETVVELASHDNIRGYKAAGGDVSQISQIIEQTRDEAFDVLAGDDAMTLPLLALGGTGVISVVANVLPERTVEMVTAGNDGDVSRARELHHALGPLMRMLFAEPNPIPVKTARAIQGEMEPTLREPLTAASPSVRKELETLLAEYTAAPAGEAA